MDLFAIRTPHQAKEQTLPQQPGYQEREVDTLFS
jgi:hypothetical protein